MFLSLCFPVGIEATVVGPTWTPTTGEVEACPFNGQQMPKATNMCACKLTIWVHLCCVYELLLNDATDVGGAGDTFPARGQSAV